MLLRSTASVPTPQWLDDLIPESSVHFYCSHPSVAFNDTICESSMLLRSTSILPTPQWLAFTQPLSHASFSEPLLLLSPLSGLMT